MRLAAHSSRNTLGIVARNKVGYNTGPRAGAEVLGPPSGSPGPRDRQARHATGRSPCQPLTAAPAPLAGSAPSSAAAGTPATAPRCPAAAGAGQGAFLRGSRPVGRLLQAGSLLAAAHRLLDTLQRAAHMRGQAAGQQADRLAALDAQETPHLRTRRTLARIRPVGPQPAGARPTPRTRRRSCQIPGPLANIVLVGEMGLEKDLHGCTGHGPASWCRAGHL